MKILSICTSTMISTCTIMEDGEIIGDCNINQQKTHSESLVPMIKNMLDNLNIDISEVDLYVMAKGPGSFTGLRIGMTTGKTLAQVFDKDALGISTLEALAVSCLTDKYIVPLVDARGGRVYYGIYKWEDENLVNIKEDSLIFMEDLAQELKDTDREYLFVGEGSRIFKDLIIEENLGSLAIEPLNNCIGRGLCYLGEKYYSKGIKDDIYTLSPAYIRKSQAQRDLELKEQNAKK